MNKERVPIFEFVMPIGKYKGNKLTDLWYKDKQYMDWAAGKFKNRIGDRIREFIEAMNELDRKAGSTNADI
jgi:uncharacterized protein (DUF3820 family)